jgi:multiple sugar transport system permease protein
MTSEKRTLIEHLVQWATWNRLVFALAFTFFLTGIVFPFYWMVSSSFKSYQEIGARKTVYIPSKIRVDAFRELFDPTHRRFQNFQRNIINTLTVSVPTAIIAVVLSVFGAYAIARLSFAGKNFLLNGILLVYLFPGVLLIIPLFAMLSKIGAHLGFSVQDNLPLLVVTYLSQTLPVALYMLTNYFRTIPDEIEQAALIDGCSRVAVIWRVTMPLAVPALVTVGIYTFMIAWNEFLYALVFLNSHELFTMPIKINTIFNDPTPRPHVVMAASTVMTIPIVTLFLLMQRYLEEGLTAGGVKG